jgi:group I intron endonuclease
MMEKYYIVYKITNTISKKCYIGKHETFNAHDKYFGSGIALKDAIKKYGIDCFKKEIIEFCESSEILSEREKYWIEKENSIVPNGYNISLGGKGGDNFTHNPNKNAILEKMKKNRIPRKWTEEEKERRRNVMLGKKLKPHDKIECKFCSKEVSNANYKRWHGEKCKENPDRIHIDLPTKFCVFCKENKNPVEYSLNHDLYCVSNPNRIIRKKEKIECEYCKKSTSPNNYKIFHGENCKKNPIYQDNKDLFEKSKNYEISEKLSKSMKGKEVTKETREKMSLSLKNRVITEETKNKMRESTAKRWALSKENPTFYECEYCNKSVTNKTNYIRWHGKNCKNKK